LLGKSYLNLEYRFLFSMIRIFSQHQAFDLEVLSFNLRPFCVCFTRIYSQFPFTYVIHQPP